MPLQELDFAGISKMIEDVGVPQILGSGLDLTAGVSTMMTVPPGHCFIITKIVSDGSTLGAPFDGSPNLGASTANSLLIRDADGATQSSVSIRSFIRWQTPFEQAATPTWRTSPPNGFLCWTPKWPICIPPGWSIANGGVGDLGNGLVAYGYLMGVDEARTLGFDTNSSTTDTDRRYGIVSSLTTGSAVEILAGRAGKHIQILDVLARVQPESPETTGLVTVRQTDDRNIFQFANNNPNNLQQFIFSPGIFLAEGQGIEILSTPASIGTVCIQYRFVDPEDVPGDHWWACLTPQLATPGVTKIGTGSNVTSSSTAVTCFYPRRGTTKTTPTQGFQHILRGYAFSIQKDNTVAGDVTVFRLSAGGSGSIGQSVLGVTDDGVPISPVIVAYQQNQASWGVVDGLNVVCPKDTVSINVDVNSYGALFVTTPAQTDTDIDEFWVTVWGKTIPNRFHGHINRGAAS